MKGKDVLGTLSPAYGLMTGRGAFGKVADSGMAGIIPTMLSNQRRKKKDGTEMTAVEAAVAEKPAMRKGGSVKKMASGGSASKRADGCAVRGKTRGKMV